jgi:hypothetical protein
MRNYRNGISLMRERHGLCPLRLLPKAQARFG